MWVLILTDWLMVFLAGRLSVSLPAGLATGEAAEGSVSRDIFSGGRRERYMYKQSLSMCVLVQHLQCVYMLLKSVCTHKHTYIHVHVFD